MVAVYGDSTLGTILDLLCIILCNECRFMQAYVEINSCYTCKTISLQKLFSQPLPQTSFNDGPDGRVYCGGCHKTLRLMDVNLTARSAVDTTAIPGGGDRDACVKCSGKVFEAEKMVAKRGLYHKKCFREEN